MMSGYLHKVGLGRTRYQNEASLASPFHSFGAVEVGKGAKSAFP